MLARSSAVSWGVRFAEEVQCRRTDRPCHRLAAGQPRVFRHRAERHHRSRRGAERLALSLFPRGQAADRQRRDRLRRRRGGVLPRPRRDPGPHARNVLRQFTATLRGWLEHSRFEEACPVLSTSLSIDAELAPVHAECRRALRAWHASIERALRADGLAEKLAASRAWLILAALEGRSRWPASSGRSRRWMQSRKNCRRYCRPRRVSRPGRPGIRQCCTLSTAIASPETSR